MSILIEKKDIKYMSKVALCRVNYSQLYSVYDGGKTYKHRDVIPPYHLITLASAISNIADVSIFDSEVDLMTEKQLVEKIININPDIVGFTSTTPDIDITLSTCKKIREYNPNIIIVIGGPHVTAVPQTLINNTNIDYIVSGDGEDALYSIVSKNKQPKTPEIIYGESFDVSKIKMPSHNLLDYSKYLFSDPTKGQLQMASVMSSRGCPFKCIFCASNKNFRNRPVENFLEEINYLYYEKNIRYFYVYDDTFLCNKERANIILDELIHMNLKDAHLQCLTRANLINGSIVDKLKKANFVRVSMGVESGSNHILQKIKKGVKKEDYITACDILSQMNMDTRASFIIGHPTENHSTIHETIEFSKELALKHANFNIMTPYPGTKIYEMATNGNGIYFDKPEYSCQWKEYRRWGKSIIKTDDLTSSDLEFYQKYSQIEFYARKEIYDYYYNLYEKGNTSRYFFRPLNFAWLYKFGKPIEFWNKLPRLELIEPK